MSIRVKHFRNNDYFKLAEEVNEFVKENESNNIEIKDYKLIPMVAPIPDNHKLTPSIAFIGAYLGVLTYKISECLNDAIGVPSKQQNFPELINFPE
jgi:hypothetical protein